MLTNQQLWYIMEDVDLSTSLFWEGLNDWTV